MCWAESSMAYSRESGSSIGRFPYCKTAVCGPSLFRRRRASLWWTLELQRNAGRLRGRFPLAGVVGMAGASRPVASSRGSRHPDRIRPPFSVGSSEVACRLEAVPGAARDCCFWRCLGQIPPLSRNALAQCYCPKRVELCDQSESSGFFQTSDRQASTAEAGSAVGTDTAMTCF